ncbi:MAG: hypothetical protein JWN34_2222 [Bryobacterales bacterium]|nr:hypothetical protein [Bryobacterales bacterium]
MQVIPWRNKAPNVHPIERAVSVVTGGMLFINGIRNGGFIRMAAGAAILGRGLTGRCHMYRLLGIHTAPSDSTLPYELGVKARAAVTVGHPRHEIYEFWRQFENLPRFMRHLVSVDQTDTTHSHWVAEGPGGHTYEWDAEIINEIPDQLIGWKSLPGSQIASAGSVRFTEAPGDRGTEIRVELQYNPPAGIVGAWASRLFGREPEQEISADLKRLKQFFETGEVATTAGQSNGVTPLCVAAGRTGYNTMPSLDEVLP